MDILNEINESMVTHGVATIDIREAHIWWNTPLSPEDSPSIRVFRFSSANDHAFAGSEESDCHSDTGACWIDWKKRSVPDLLAELQEMAIELSARGIPVLDVVRELAKIRQFAALGARSFYMARALSVALVGSAYDSLECWDKFVD